MKCLTNKGDRAILVSEKLEAPEDQVACFTFWYHSSGESIGFLEVKIADRDENPANEQVLWKLYGAQSDDRIGWKKGVVPLDALRYPYDFYKIKIEGSIGDGIEDQLLFGHIAYYFIFIFPNK